MTKLRTIDLPPWNRCFRRPRRFLRPPHCTPQHPPPQQQKHIVGGPFFMGPPACGFAGRLRQGALHVKLSAGFCRAAAFGVRAEGTPCRRLVEGCCLAFREDLSWLPLDHYFSLRWDILSVQLSYGI